MSCLPNKFPLPIFLLINKCDQIDRIKRRNWMEKNQMEAYIKENQFYEHFFVRSNSRNSVEYELDYLNRESMMTNISVDPESPLKCMIWALMKFRDLKEKIVAISSTNKKQTRSSCDDSTYIGDEDFMDKHKDKSTSGNCSIL
jgi:hypothetical protein